MTLRPTEEGAAARAFEIRSDREVTRMPTRAAFPPSWDEIAR